MLGREGKKVHANMPYCLGPRRHGMDSGSSWRLAIVSTAPAATVGRIMLVAMYSESIESSDRIDVR